MGFHLVTVELTASSGLARDSCLNSFAVKTDPAWNPATQLGDVTIPIMQFYAQPSAGFQVGQFISNAMSRAAGAVKMKVYNVAGVLNGQPHGSPIAQDTGTLPAPISGAQLPAEVASVLTLRSEGWALAPVEAPDGGDPGVALDRPKQRYTGRIYVGPLNVTAQDSSGAKVGTGFQQYMRESFNATRDLLVGYGHAPCVWSRADGIFREVTHVQTDDAFDTQRRRGISPTLRTTLQIN